MCQNGWSKHKLLECKSRGSKCWTETKSERAVQMNQRGLRPFEAQMDGRVPGKDMMRYRLKRPFEIWNDLQEKTESKKNSYYTVKKMRHLSLFSQWTEISSVRRSWNFSKNSGLQQVMILRFPVIALFFNIQIAKKWIRSVQSPANYLSSSASQQE